MRFLSIAVFMLFLGVLGIYGAGSSLPDQSTKILGVALPVEQDALWQSITDYQSMESWHHNITKVNALPEAETGDTLWHVKMQEDDFIVLKVINIDIAERMQWKLLESNLPFQAEWEISLIDKTAKTEDQAAEEAEAVTFIKIKQIASTSNAFTRFYMQYVTGYDGFMNEYLNALAAHYKVTNPEIRELVA